MIDPLAIRIAKIKRSAIASCSMLRCMVRHVSDNGHAREGGGSLRLRTARSLRQKASASSRHNSWLAERDVGEFKGRARSLAWLDKQCTRLLVYFVAAVVAIRLVQVLYIALQHFRSAYLSRGRRHDNRFVACALSGQPAQLSKAIITRHTTFDRTLASPTI
jgi:hypothetical protein